MTTQEDSQREAFSAGYKAGWKARGEYIRDYRNSLTGSSFGLGLMFLGGAMLVTVVLLGIINAISVIDLIIPLSIVTGIAAIGTYIDKLENASLAKKQAEFKEKWGE